VEEYTETHCIFVSRAFVFRSNISLLLVGLAAMGYAIYVWVDDSMDWADNDLPLRFTIFAAFLILLALLGIQGTWDEVERCDLVVYLVLLFVIVVLQIVAVIYVAVNESDVKEYLEDTWDDWSDPRKLKGMESYECGVYHPNPPSILGFNGGAINVSPYNVAKCVDPSGADEKDYCFEDCYSEARTAFTTFGTLTTIFSTLFALFELMVLIASCILVCNRPDYVDYEYDTETESEEKNGTVV